MIKRKCPFCGKIMKNVCVCGAYRVTDETHGLPLKKQPYVLNKDLTDTSDSSDIENLG